MKGINDLKLAFLSFIICTGAILAQGNNNAKFRVVLDAGHGGKDYGANYHGYIEKNIALNTVLKIGKLLEKEDVQVIYTRKTDVFVELDERAKVANRADANLFVSIHCNAETKKTAFGAETFFIGTSKNASNLEVAKKENAVINLEANSKEKYGGYDPNNPESFIGISLGQEQNIKQAIDLARKVQDNFKDDNKRKDRGVKPAPFLVLHKTAMPSILVELGFLSYKEEGEWLNSDGGQNDLAESIAKAIVAYKKEFFTAGTEEYKPAPENAPDKDDKPVANTPAKTNTATTAAAAQKGVIYKVQISASGKSLDLTPSNFKGLDQLSKDDSTSTIKYFYGNTSDLEKARELLEVAKAKGFPSAFIVPFRDGKKITMQEALKKK
ncbi:N-acetylmuramoyl-L-alanine amidase [Flavobacterium akiainvivens]|uniref:N-acetylmuramoyl-L-alanine amidase n=1 Tax=Flavobacterium akiainvivens TaxID=1202724 RepID=A0A0M8MGM8_9FLAO|nr:N-acetylmuramoyl-L-alanine amidase [Flavobacterium akiainvivens]KOS05377.1 N-acetylmuramoyl-L-alanine amidase [Flavobacterium akiainvivens]SFQ73853.1 N-acetylmuramoyl-L-alanine amidase [Flavobacterium akiainvivens]